MTLNPFQGMNRRQIDQCRTWLQLAAALGSFEAAFEALDRCTGDEEVEIKLWEMAPEELDKLVNLTDFVQTCGGGEQARQALRDLAALEASGRERTSRQGEA